MRTLKAYKFRIHLLFYKNPQKKIKDLASQLGVSIETIKKWKYIPITSDSDLSFMTIQKIAKFFNVKPQEVYTDYEFSLNLEYEKLQAN